MEQRVTVITLGYSGVFLDPDEHPWEVAHNPFWTLTADAAVALGD